MADVMTGAEIVIEALKDQGVETLFGYPVDTKVRKRAAPEAGQWKVLGWDAAGVVAAVGPEAALFKPRDEVLIFYNIDVNVVFVV